MPLPDATKPVAHARLPAGRTPAHQTGLGTSLSCLKDDAGRSMTTVQSFHRPSDAVGARRDGVARLSPPDCHARDWGSSPRRASLVLEVPGFRPGLYCRACPTARDPREV